MFAFEDDEWAHWLSNLMRCYEVRVLHFFGWGCLLVFLIPLNVPLASVIGLINLVIYKMYIVSNILPLIYTHCPYRTSFSDILNVLTRPIRALPSLARTQIHMIFPSYSEVVSVSSTDTFMTLKEAERIAATANEVAEDVACSAMLWLYRMTSNPPTKRIILESLGCLSGTVSKRFDDIDETELRQTLDEIELYRLVQRFQFSIIPGQERRTERLLRGPRQVVEFGGSWKVDSDTFELPLQMVAAILTHHRDVVVESQTWVRDKFLVHLIRQHLNNQPICLPSVLWVRLISAAYTGDVPRLTGNEDDTLLLSLCELALQNLSATADTIIPFSGPVSITDTAIPLFQFVVDLIAARLGNICPVNSFESDPLTKLFIIHDYGVSCLPSMGSTDGSNIAMSVMDSAWEEIQTLTGLSENDTHALCQRVESVVLRNLTLDDVWCDSGNDTVYCYHSILYTYRISCDSHIASPEFFERLFFDWCSLLMINGALGYSASQTLEKIFCQHTDMLVYCTIFSASLFLSNARTLTSLSSFRQCLYPAMAAFISRFTGGVGMPREAALRCMDDLSADPQRLYTVCRVIALGDDRRFSYSEDLKEDWAEDVEQHLLHLARFDPTHTVWTQRMHYMSMEPQDWPYLCLVVEELNDEEIVARVKERMKIALAILDELFDSLNHVSL